MTPPSTRATCVWRRRGPARVRLGARKRGRFRAAERRTWRTPHAGSAARTPASRAPTSSVSLDARAIARQRKNTTARLCLEMEGRGTEAGAP
jgi:hypothetical protein